jgi:hypothetical protein
MSSQSLRYGLMGFCSRFVVPRSDWRMYDVELDGHLSGYEVLSDGRTPVSIANGSVYADWYDSQQIGRGHVPITEGCRLAYCIEMQRSEAADAQSRVMLQRMVELDVRFQPWSSGRRCQDETLLLCFYFQQKADAALFTLLWGTG